jgi:hypothetical protein
MTSPLLLPNYIGLQVLRNHVYLSNTYYNILFPNYLKLCAPLQKVDMNMALAYIDAGENGLTTFSDQVM